MNAKTLERSYDLTTLNLDAMTAEELREFVAFIGNQGIGDRPIDAANKLFGRSFKNRVRATKDLRNYAWNKITAIGCRMRGEIAVAQQYEAICERIYAQLPDVAKW